ncbi:hypothetical protein [Mycobacterium sp. D16R24]|uniref:hypothetical protein n=1 Tax=Mycobacterium sp. D16R24 TaxID=1855656 RepID=UPI000992409B|nr:hypothetical protein [Mycobacterium sp. D16R24]
MIGNDSQSLYPSQPDYSPSQPPDSVRLEPGGVSAGATVVEGTAYEQAATAITHAHKELARHLEATEKEAHRYSSSGYSEQIALFANTDAVKAVDRAEQQVEARYEKARAEFDGYLSSLVTPGDAAAESRNTRFWHRSERLLDSSTGHDKMLVARDLIKNSTREQLGVLLEELPTYLKSTGLSADWIDDYTRQCVPEYAAIKKRLDTAESGKMLLQHSARYLRRCIADGRRGDAQVMDRLDFFTAGRLPIDRRGTLRPTNGGKFDPDK